MILGGKPIIFGNIQVDKLGHEVDWHVFFIVTCCTLKGSDCKGNPTRPKHSG